MKTALGLSAAGGLLLFTAFRQRTRLGLVEDTARSKASSAPQGLLELEGFAWPQGMTARGSDGTEIVYSSILLQKRVTRNDGKRSRRKWETVFRRVRSAPFWLVDATGCVNIDPAEAELALSDARVRGWGDLTASERERFCREILDSPVSDFPPAEGVWKLFSSSFRVIESEIGVGSPIYARGEFRTPEGGPCTVTSPGLGSFCASVFEKTATRQPAFDGDRDGRVSEVESRSGSIQLAASVRAGATTTNEPEVELHGTLGSSGEHRLYLADAHEEFLRARLGKGLLLRFLAGSLLMAGALTVLVRALLAG